MQLLGQANPFLQVAFVPLLFAGGNFFSPRKFFTDLSIAFILCVVIKLQTHSSSENKQLGDDVLCVVMLQSGGEYSAHGNKGNVVGPV